MKPIDAMVAKFAQWTPEARAERLEYRRQTRASAQREINALLRAGKVAAKREGKV